MGQKGIKKKPSVLLSFAIAAGVIVFLLMLSKLVSGGRPSDRRLVRGFQQHRAAFAELKTMIATNNPSRNPQATAAVWSMADYQKYLKLRRLAGVNRAYVENGEYHFQVVGPDSAGKAKCRVAIVWREDAPDRVIGSLDEFHKTSSDPEHAYRALGEGWYLWITQ